VGTEIRGEAEILELGGADAGLCSRDIQDQPETHRELGAGGTDIVQKGRSVPDTALDEHAEDDMSFDTPNGTRGGWQPGTGGVVGRWLTKRAVNRIRRSGKAMGLGFDALVLTTIGRKTGAERTTPVGRFPGKDGSWLIVASAAGGPRNPAWYYNLAAHPTRSRSRWPAAR
jgi:F420H(2)-dependent quinone reductase